MELAEGPGRIADVLRLLGLSAVLAIVAVRGVEIGHEKLVDRQVEAPQSGGGDEAIVLGPALRRPIATETNIPPVEGRDGLLGRLVEAIGRYSERIRRHSQTLNPLDYRLPKSCWPRRLARDKHDKYSVRLELCQRGRRGSNPQPPA